MNVSIDCWGGREFSIDPDRTALIVIDMQRDFLDPQGMCAIEGADIALMRAIIPTVARLTTWARRRGIHLVHTREGYAPDFSDMHKVKRENQGPITEGPLGRFLIRGQAGHDFISNLQPELGEWVIDKPGFSAFYGTDLHQSLQQAGVETLILSGVTTNCCVQSTLRDAVDRGYRCLSVADACAAVELDDHDRSIDLIAAEGNLFGWVCNSAALLGPPTRRPFKGSIRAMADEDADPVLAIYAEGIATGHATFQAEVGDWASFTAGKRHSPRLVACDGEGGVIGFAVLSPTSARPVYAGVCEVSIYVATRAQGQGAGQALMAALTKASDAEGIWQLTAGIFPENKASLLLHTAHGFRCQGRQPKAAQMTYGPLKGKWRDVLKLQRQAG